VTPWTWSHSVHHWHLPHPHLPRLPRAPRLQLSDRRVAALRKGAIVALCALISGGLTFHLRGAARGAFAPTPPAAAARA